MPVRQDTLAYLDVLHTLTGYLGRAAYPETRLQPFLEGLLQTLRGQYPQIVRAEIYLQGESGAFRRWAGLGIPPDVPELPEPSSPVVQALARREPVTPGAKTGSLVWAVPLLARNEDTLGALRVDLPATSPELPALRTLLLTLAGSLSLAVEHLQNVPLARALGLSQQLVATRSLQDMVGVIAEYVGPECSLIDLSTYEYEDDKRVRARSVVLAVGKTSELTDFLVDIADYTLVAALPQLQLGQPIQIGDVYATPLIPPDKHGYFRAQAITRLTLIPLISDNRLLGTLSIAGRKFTPNELTGLQTLGNQIAVLVQNRTLFERTASALDEVQQLYRFGSAILNARDAAGLLKALYDQFSTPPDELSLEGVHLDTEGHVLAFVTQAVISRGGLVQGGTVIDISTHNLNTYAQTLETGTPLLINNLKTDSSLHPAAHAYFVGRGWQAFGIFPILIEGNLVSTLTAAYQGPHIFTGAEIRLMHRLCEQIGLELRNWQLLQQTQDQARRLTKQVRLMESLYETSRQVSTHLASADILKATCRSIDEKLGLGYVALIRFDQVPGCCNVIAESPVRLGSGTVLGAEEFGVYRHLQTYRTPAIVRQVDAADDLLGTNRTRFQELGLQSVLFAPLLVQGDLIGALVLASIPAPREFSQEEINVAQAIATQIAISMRNAELFAEIQHRANQLEQIAVFGRLVTSTFDRDEILRRIIDVVPNLLPAQQILIAQYSAGQNQVHLTTLVGDVKPEEIDLPAEASSVQEVVQTQVPILVPDLQSSAYSDHRRLAGQGLEAVVVAPLVVGSSVIGAVSLAHKRARIYTPTDLTLLQQIGNQIAIALENARRFAMTRQRAVYEESLSQITSRLQQQADLRDMLQQTVQDLGTALGARRARVRLMQNNHDAHSED